MHSKYLLVEQFAFEPQEEFKVKNNCSSSFSWWKSLSVFNWYITYNRIKDKNLPIRRVNISFNNLVEDSYRQYDLFTDPLVIEREKNMQKAMIAIKKKYGKNAVLKGMNLEEGAKTMERNHTAYKNLLLNY